jgi:hypothetical protein
MPLLDGHKMKKTLSETLYSSKYQLQHQNQEILLQDVNRGSKTAAFGLIDELRRNLVKDPYSISEPVREWLVKCLLDITFKKVSGKKALGLTGKNQMIEPEHPIQFKTQEIYDHITKTGLPLHKSTTSPSAFRDAADKFNISPSTAESYYRHAKDNYFYQDAEFLRDITGLTDEEINSDQNLND